MPARTVRFAGILGGQGVTAERVGTGSDEFKMVRPDASRIPAQMIRLEAGWNRPVLLFIHPAVSTYMRRPLPNGPVPVLVVVPNPLPAPILANHVADGVRASAHRAQIDLDEGTDHGKKYPDWKAKNVA